MNKMQTRIEIAVSVHEDLYMKISSADGLENTGPMDLKSKHVQLMGCFATVMCLVLNVDYV
jgi:hypothetical protein